MTIAKCKKCKGSIITTEHLDNKKDVLCIVCIMKIFTPSKVDNYVIHNGCGVAVKTLNDANEHLRECNELNKGEQK